VQPADQVWPPASWASAWPGRALTLAVGHAAVRHDRTVFAEVDVIDLHLDADLVDLEPGDALSGVGLGELHRL
jgi:hypothetical protein